MSETIIPVPVDVRAKEDADAALAPLGLTTVEVLRRTVEEIARDGASAGTMRLDLEKPLVPNAETIAAIEEARRGELKSFNTIEELIEDLHSDADD
jgi:DNA-damage-inducible protein J